MNPILVSMNPPTTVPTPYQIRSQEFTVNHFKQKMKDLQDKMEDMSQYKSLEDPKCIQDMVDWDRLRRITVEQEGVLADMKVRFAESIVDGKHDPVMDLMTKIQLFKRRIAENYDNIEIVQIRVHPKTLGDILGSEMILKFIPETVVPTEQQLYQVMGFQLRDDYDMKEGEYRFVVGEKYG